MEKTTIAAVGATAIAVWLFLSTTQQHDADRDVRSARHERDAAEFDRDFKKSTTGKDDPQLVERAKIANEDLEAKKAKQVSVDQDQSGRQKSLQSEVEASMKKDGVDLQKIAADVNKSK